MNTNQKYEQLQGILRSLERVVVAYSGGVDSTFLLKAAIETLGKDRVLACIGVSPSLARSQYDQAMDNALAMGAKVREVTVEELDDQAYAANRADRCFHCKSYLYSVLTKIGVQAGFGVVICGSNYDDKDDYRPGNQAALKLNVGSPLMEAQLTKAEIRTLSRDMNLATADIPASPCLASRMAYGLEITADRLAQVEKAEDLLRSLGFVEFRVRHHDILARIEVTEQDMPRLMEYRGRITESIKGLGFTYVTMDLQGFRSGSLNETLSRQQKQVFRSDPSALPRE
ncbi:MAG: ATP-dependent sacrificial sulfur transferase LarE [Planctomycetes bacterium]|nr:ATP-dependent sacrificial sulfur transferase LarE [Planctomycetota bacterium]